MSKNELEPGKHVYRVDEENVNGCEEVATVYANFSQRLSDEQMSQLREILYSVKANDQTWDCTDDIVDIAIKQFEKETGIKGELCDPSIEGVIAF